MRWLREVVSKNKGWENFFAFVLLSMAVVASFFVALSVLGWTELLGSGAANWVQAFGSIAAIVGAAWLANDSRRRDLAERQRELLYKEIKAINRVMAGVDRVINKAMDLQNSLQVETPVSPKDEADDLKTSGEMLKIAMEGIDEASSIWVLCFDTAQRIPRVCDKASAYSRLLDVPPGNGWPSVDYLRAALEMAGAEYKREDYKLMDSAVRVRDACRSFIKYPSMGGVAVSKP